VFKIGRLVIFDPYFCTRFLRLKSSFLSMGFLMCGILDFCTTGEVNDCVPWCPLLK